MYNEKSDYFILYRLIQIIYFYSKVLRKIITKFHRRREKLSVILSLL